MLTVNGFPSQPHTVCAPQHNRTVDEKNFITRAIVAQNIRALMVDKHGPSTQAQLKKKSGVAQATIGRLLREEASPTADTLAAIAGAYELEAWQLLVAGMDPSNPPVLMPVSKAERALYDKLREAAVGIAALDRAPYKVEPKSG